ASVWLSTMALRDFLRIGFPLPHAKSHPGKEPAQLLEDALLIHSGLGRISHRLMFTSRVGFAWIEVRSRGKDTTMTSSVGEEAAVRPFRNHSSPSQHRSIAVGI